jgi:hypothetical protein
MGRLTCELQSDYRFGFAVEERSSDEAMRAAKQTADTALMRLGILRPGMLPLVRTNADIA